MSNTTQEGWISRTTVLRSGAVEVLTLAQGYETVCLPAHPPVARTMHHMPVFSLTLILNELPRPEGDDPARIVGQSLLTLGLTLRLPDEVWQVLNDVTGGHHRALFTRNALFALVYRPEGGEETILAAQPAGGSNARATLSLLCGREETLELLKALNKQPNALTLRVYIAYPYVPVSRTLSLNGNWRAIRMVIAQVMERSGFISREELQCCFHAMQDTGIIKASIEGDIPVDADVYQNDLFALFARNIAPILTPAKSVDEAGSVIEGYLLKRQYLDETMMLNCRQIVTTPEERHLELNAPLEYVLGGVLDGLNREHFISALHYPSGKVVPLRPLRRSRSNEGCFAGK